jgi:hypothetical protein
MVYNIGKKGRLVLPDKSFLNFTILDEIRRPQSGLPTKIIYLQKVKYEDSRKELRLYYYIVGKLPKMKGKSVFGQFATLPPAQGFKAIVDEAKVRGWI